MRRFAFLLFLIPFLLAGCSAEGPSGVIRAYLDARVAVDADTMRSLSCAEWESQALIQAQSFRSMQAELENVTCSDSGADGDFALVTCDGKIVTTYNGETREWPLGTYRLKQEDGQWKMCGESDPAQ